MTQNKPNRILLYVAIGVLILAIGLLNASRNIALPLLLLLAVVVVFVVGSRGVKVPVSSNIAPGLAAMGMFVLAVVLFIFMPFNMFSILLLLLGGVVLAFWLGGWRVGGGCLVPVALMLTMVFGTHAQVVFCISIIVAALVTVVMWLMRKTQGWNVVAFCVYSILAIISFNITCGFGCARAYASFDSERDILRQIGSACIAYSGDYDGKMPPKANWAPALKNYLRDTSLAAELPNRYQEFQYGDSPQKTYQFSSPPSDADWNTWPVIKVNGWEDYLGRRIVLYASGEVKVQNTWPWWKYYWEGKPAFR